MSSNMMSLAMLGVFVIVIYFMMIRPQKKKEKADKEMRDSLTPGDEIVTIGGFLGKVVKVKEKTVIISVGSARTQMEILKTAISIVTNHSDDNRPARAPKSESEEKEVNRDKKVTPKKLTNKKEEPKAEVKEQAAEVAPTEDAQ